MKRSIATKAAFCIAAFLAATAAHAQPFGYAVNSDGYHVPDEQIDNLYRINLSTGESERIGPTGFLDIEGLAFSANGELLGADDESNSLLRIDDNNANTTAIGGLPGNFRLPGSQVLDLGLSFTCNALYASSDSLSTLYLMDEESGEALLIGSTGAPITGLASFGETLYGIGAGEEAPNLYRVDPETGATSLIGPLDNAAPYVDAGLDFDSEGRLWAITDRRNVNNESHPSQILQIDTETGVATVVAETLYGIEGLAIAPPGGCDINGPGPADPAPIPTLNSAALFLTALLLFFLGLFSLTRRNG